MCRMATPGDRPAADLDQTDLKLLALLQRDARMTNAELGQAVGLGASSVNDRVRKLTDRGVITGVRAGVDPAAVGLDLLAFVFVGLSDQRVEQDFLARVRSEPNVQECHHVTGTWNYLMKLRVANTSALETFFRDVLKTLPGVVRTETLIVLSTTKEDAFVPTTPGAAA